MELTFAQTYEVHDNIVDRYGRLRPAALLYLAQEMAGKHCDILGLTQETMASKDLFWAVSRHKVRINRLPRSGEKILLQTWPMPTTRVAYPRALEARDEADCVLFQVTSLWVLMDRNTRAMVLPGKSGVEVEGLLLGSELMAPGSIAPKALVNTRQRTVLFTDLDWNGHMNNCRHLDWAMDLLPAEFHRQRSVSGFTVCYLSEATEGENLTLQWELEDGPCVTVNALRTEENVSTGRGRVFALQMQF
jgi:acyl-ACP thioesterase